MSSTDPHPQSSLANFTKVTPPSYNEATLHNTFDTHFQSLETRFNQILTNIKSLLPPTTPVNQPTPGTLPPSLPSPVAPDLTTICPASTDVPVKSCVTSPLISSMPPLVRFNHCPSNVHLSDRRRQYLKRLFSPPDSEPSHAQSYTYVYLPRSRPMNRQEIRSIFRVLSIDNHRILDITFPAKDTIGVLLHEAYLPEFQSKFLEIDTSFLSDFDPLDPKHIADRKYHNLPKEDRIRLAHSLQQKRCIRTLNFVRSHLVLGLAKYFINQGWIPAQLAQSLIDKRIPSRDKRLTSTKTLDHTDSQFHNSTAPGLQCSQSQTNPSSTLDHIHNPAPHRYRDPMPNLAPNPSNSMKNHSPPTASPPRRMRKLRKLSKNKQPKS